MKVPSAAALPEPAAPPVAEVADSAVPVASAEGTRCTVPVMRPGVGVVVRTASTTSDSPRLAPPWSVSPLTPPTS